MKKPKRMLVKVRRELMLLKLQFQLDCLSSSVETKIDNLLLIIDDMSKLDERKGK